MKNPSCPDSIENQTFRNMVTYAAKLDASSLDVVNLFARRTGSSPRELNGFEYRVAVGPENDTHVRAAAEAADRIIVAWGSANGVKWYGRRVTEIDRLLRDRNLWSVRLPRGTPNPLHPQVWSPRYELGLWRRSIQD
jgi:hypothetical protein